MKWQEHFKYPSNTGPKYLHSTIMVKEGNTDIIIEFQYWLDTKLLFIIREMYSFEDTSTLVILVEKTELNKIVNSIKEGYNNLKL